MAILTAYLLAGVGATIWGQFPQDTTVLLALDIAVGVAGCALAPVLVSRPVPVTILLGVLAAVSPAATPPATVGALYVAHRRRFAVAAAVGAVGIAGQIIRDLWRPTRGLSLTWWVILVVAAYAALVGWGAMVRANGALIASLRERARRAEEEQARRVEEARLLERTRIAREMHDVLAHRLSLLATYAGALEYRPGAPAGELSRAAGVIRSGAHEALEELREVIGVLREDPGEDPPGGSERPQPTLDDLSALAGESRAAGSPVELRTRLPAAPAVPASTGRTAYRIAQEGLTNARKHAPGQPVRLTVSGTPGAELVIEISNPLPDTVLVPAGSAGTAVAAGLAAPVPGSGTGLIGLSERARLAGGRIEYGPAGSGEFRLRAWLPWPE
ncbi:MAG: sensor histidine kinase [Actinobacteria bacterium]|nr:sensor histidine kinase [Actinomycetota bacterium]MBO0787321.1 sensor histidine kinase [Actinomycetota bacterium]